MGRRNRWRRFVWLLTSLLAIGIWGCGGASESPKAKVSGEVKLDGKPMEDGEITFVTVAEGVRETLPVKNGKYAGEVQLGERRVEIRAYRESKAGTEMYGPDATTSKENYIADKYNTNSTLTAKVTSEGPNTFPFEVTSKSK